MQGDEEEGVQIEDLPAEEGKGEDGVHAEDEGAGDRLRRQDS